MKKVDLGKSYWIPQTKLALATYFFEVISLECGIKMLMSAFFKTEGIFFTDFAFTYKKATHL